MKFKTHKVIMLSTENESRIYLYKNKDLIYKNQFKKQTIGNYTYVNQHLYILSDDEIKEGDYVVLGDGKTLKRMYTKDVLDWANSYSSATKKIIASTDTSLGLPSPSEDFILKYVEMYNKNTPITEVMVEYTICYIGINKWGERGANYHKDNMREIEEEKEVLKVNLKDNTITIKKGKDTFTREEVLKLLLIYEGQCILKGPNNTPSAQEFLNNY